MSVSTGTSPHQKDIYNRIVDYIERLKAQGCYVVTSNVFGNDFSCAIKVLDFDIDNPNAYTHPHWQNYEKIKEKLFVPAGGRTSPCNRGRDLYKYCGNQGSFSWAIPYLVGVFALALQVKPDLSYDEFCDMARRTATLNNNGIYIINPIGIIKSCQ